MADARAPGGAVGGQYGSPGDERPASPDSGWGEGSPNRANPNAEGFGFPALTTFKPGAGSPKGAAEAEKPKEGDGAKTPPPAGVAGGPAAAGGATAAEKAKSPNRSGGDGKDDRLAQSWPPRTPGTNIETVDDAIQHDAAAGGFSLDGQPAQAGGQDALPHPRLAGEDKLTDVQHHFCVCTLNGAALLQCPVPRPGDNHTVWAAADIPDEMQLFGEPDGMFLQAMFFSPNFPQKCDYSVHGTLELLGKGGSVEASVYLGVLEEGKQVEKKQRTIARRPAQFRLTVHRIAATGPNPNEAQLIEEITAVLENQKLNPGKGSLPSVLVQHRAKESPLYDKVVGRRFGNSWHAFMKANQDAFTLFHYSQKEIGERKLAPFCKFNEARIVLRAHEQQGDWRAADERAAAAHAQAEEGLKQHLIGLLEQRDYDQRELLDVLNGNQHFNHFLSPTFSILMRTLNRHKGTFIASTDADQPTRVGLSRPDRHQAQLGPMIAPRAAAPSTAALQHRPPPAAQGALSQPHGDGYSGHVPSGFEHLVGDHGEGRSRGKGGGGGGRRDGGKGGGGMGKGGRMGGGGFGGGGGGFGRDRDFGGGGGFGGGRDRGFGGGGGRMGGFGGRDFDRPPQRFQHQQQQQVQQQVIHVTDNSQLPLNLGGGGQQQIVLQGGQQIGGQQVIQQIGGQQVQVIHEMVGGGGGGLNLGGGGQQQVIPQSMLQMTDPQLHQALSQIPGLDQNTTVVVLQQQQQVQPQQQYGQQQQQVQYVIHEHVQQPPGLGGQQIIVQQDPISIDGMPPPGLQQQIVMQQGY